MKNRMYFLTIILIINCLGRALYAAGLIQELSTFSTKLTNLTTKITQGGTGRVLPTPPDKPVPPAGSIPTPPISGKPKEPSEPPPKFTKQFTFAYAETSAKTPTYIKIGLVGGDLIVYGPRLAEGVTPQDFIVQKEIKVPGEALPKKEDRLSFPVDADKAKGIVWSTDNKIINEGSLASFVLVKATDYKALQEQEQNIQDLITTVRPEITSTIKAVSAVPSGGKAAFLNQQTAETWLNKIKQATVQCEFIRDNNLSNIIKKDINDLGEKTQSLISISLTKARAGTLSNIVNSLEKEEEKLKICLGNIADIQKKPWLGDVLYRFYETYLKTPGSGAPSPISNWWVASERKITKPVIPEKPLKPAEPTGSIENFKAIEYKLELEYEQYKQKSEKDRPNFMLTETEYENPKTGASFTLKELLSYYVKKAEDRIPTLARWNQYMAGENYTSYWLH